MIDFLVNLHPAYLFGAFVLVTALATWYGIHERTKPW